MEVELVYIQLIVACLVYCIYTVEGKSVYIQLFVKYPV
jgi:hypothetical protein